MVPMSAQLGNTNSNSRPFDLRGFLCGQSPMADSGFDLRNSGPGARACWLLVAGCWIAGNREAHAVPGCLALLRGCERGIPDIGSSQGQRQPHLDLRYNHICAHTTVYNRW